MNFSNHTLAYEDLRDCTLITKNGTKIPVTIDYIETTADTLPKFEGHITGTAKVFYCNILASLFLMGFACISVLGCVFTLFRQEAGAWDYVVCADLLAAAACSVPLFSHRKELEMEPVPDSKS